MSSIPAAAPAMSNQCANCDRVSNTYNVNQGVDELVRVADQAMTAISDTFNNEVNHRPAAQQWAACTP